MVAATNAAPAILVPFFAQQWGLSNSTVALLFPFFSGGAMLGGALAGRVIVAKGYVSAIAYGYFLQAFGSLLLAFAGWPLALVAVGLAGLGLGLQSAATNLVVAGWYPLHRGQALNLLNVVFSVGAVSAGPAVSALLSLAGPRNMLLGYGLSMLALTAIVLRRTWSEPPLGQGPAVSPTDARDAWFQPLLWFTVLLIFLYCGVETAMNGWVVALAQKQGHMATYMFPLLPSLFWGAIGVGRLLAPVLISRWSGPALIFWFGLLAASGIAIMLAGTNGGAAVLILGLIICGFGLSLIFPTAVAEYAATVRASGAATTGSLFAAASSGGAAIAWLVGFLSDHAGGLSSGFAALITASLGVTACQLFINRSKVAYLAPVAAETR